MFYFIPINLNWFSILYNNIKKNKHRSICKLLLLIAQFLLYLGEVKILASSSLEDVQNIQASCLEMRSCVV